MKQREYNTPLVTIFTYQVLLELLRLYYDRSDCCNQFIL